MRIHYLFYSLKFLRFSKMYLAILYLVDRNWDIWKIKRIYSKSVGKTEVFKKPIYTSEGELTLRKIPKHYQFNSF